MSPPQAGRGGATHHCIAQILALPQNANEPASTQFHKWGEDVTRPACLAGRMAWPSCDRDAIAEAFYLCAWTCRPERDRIIIRMTISYSHMIEIKFSYWSNFIIVAVPRALFVTRATKIPLHRDVANNYFIN